MKLIIIGGGIAAVYFANSILDKDETCEVVMLSDEKHLPYDRVYLCNLIDEKDDFDSISLELNKKIQVELSQVLQSIDKTKKIVYSNGESYNYDKLIIATGSTPVSFLDTNIKNVAVFRSISDCEKIKQYYHTNEVVIVGSGPIALELLETLNDIDCIKSITLLVRNKYLYSKYLSQNAINIIQKTLLKNKKLIISYEDEIDIENCLIEDNEIKLLKTKKLNIENPFVIFGIGIKPNVKPFEEFINIDKGILVNEYMQSSDENIYAIGECAQVEKLNFIAGHVKECTTQSNVAISHILQDDIKKYGLEVTVDMLKVKGFELVEISSPSFSTDYEKIVIESTINNRIDEYFIKDNALVKFLGLNSNIDTAYIEELVLNQGNVDINYLYENREIGEKGKLICACEHTYYQDLVDLVVSCQINSFSQLKDFSKAGRVCGRCKNDVVKVIESSQHLIDNSITKKTSEEVKREKEIAQARKRIDKFKRLHPKNKLDESNLEAALKMVDIAKTEVNSWISMVTADMKLHPAFQDVVEDGVKNLNKIPIIWLELSDCSGNSEAFIKSANPAIEDLIFDYISLDYHELLMTASGEFSETILEDIIKNNKNKYILIVEGAVPLAMDGKYLRIGPKGQTGLELLQNCAKDAALVIAVGSCAFDGGVVAAIPNPTGAVGVSQALNRDDIINLPGCPTNPVNIVGTLLSYMMFEELPLLDKFNRPLWAYEQRVHDNCERRGHYELGEFVEQWGDEGAKNGWCLFQMGCKGPFANVNCPTMKFNQGTSWPVQAGHGCMGCTEAKFFDKFANERVYVQEKEEKN